MRKIILLLAICLFFSGCEDSTKNVGATDNMLRISGIDLEGMNFNIRPQDDFYGYANGRWINDTVIPAEEIGWGSYMTLRKASLDQSKVIVEEILGSDDLKGEEKKIRDFYYAWLDEALVNEKGIQPLEENLKKIDSLITLAEVVAYLGLENSNGLDGPFNFYVLHVS